MSQPVPGGAVCLVCGDVLGGAVLACPVCATPHHRECWSYLGRCAVYACAGTTLPAPAAPRAPAPRVGLQGGRYLPVDAVREEHALAHFTAEGGRLPLAAGERAVQLPTAMLGALPPTRSERVAGFRAGAAVLLATAGLVFAAWLGALPEAIARLVYLALPVTVLGTGLALRPRAVRWREASRLVWLVRDGAGALCVQTAEGIDPASAQLVGLERSVLSADVAIVIERFGSDHRLCRMLLCSFTDAVHWKGGRIPETAVELVEPWREPSDASPDAPSKRYIAAREHARRLAAVLGVRVEEVAR